MGRVGSGPDRSQPSGLVDWVLPKWVCCTPQTPTWHRCAAPHPRRRGTALKRSRVCQVGTWEHRVGRCGGGAVCVCGGDVNSDLSLCAFVLCLLLGKNQETELFVACSQQAPGGSQALWGYCWTWRQPLSGLL